jgi:hypothetical protein
MIRQGACLVLLFSVSCASRDDRAATPVVDDRLRSWTTVDPRWTACESYAADEFPPFPKFFKLGQNSSAKMANSGLDSANQYNWVVVECDSQGSCNPGSVFGSSFAVDNKRSGKGQTIFSGRPVVKWSEDPSVGKCRYVVTTPTLTSEQSRGPLLLSLELKAFEIGGSCKPEEINFEKLQPSCTSVRRAATN